MSRATRPWSPRWPPTSASPRRSSSGSSSRAPPRCWPRPSTRPPTRATRACSCSAGSGSQRSADEHHPFGYGRERYFWAFVVALVLFSLGRRVRHRRGHRQGAPPPPARLGGGGGRHPARGHRPRGHLVPHRHHGGQPHPRRRLVVAVHPPGQEPRAAGGPARGLRRPHRPRVRAGRRGPGRGHRQRPLGRPGHAGHRDAAVVPRRRAGRRDEEPAARRERHGRRRGRHPRRDRRRPRGRAAHPPAHRAPRARGAPRRSEDQLPRAPHDPRAGRGHRPRRGRRARRGADGPHHLHRARRAPRPAPTEGT